MPLITIIIPTYNRKELLEKAVLSVLHQSQKIPFEYEIIIIDDGSRDGTEEYIRKYIENPEYHITYRYQENGWVGKARNHGLSLMSQKSDYLIFLDSDDELKKTLITELLEKWDESRKNRTYDTTLGFYFLCEDEYGNILWEKKILEGKNERILKYEDYLSGAINVEMGLITKSGIFLEKPMLRYEEDITTEWVMWAKMWKYMGENNLSLYVLDMVWRLYNTNHTGEIRITKQIDPKRFKKNAIGNERILDINGEDLKHWDNTVYYSELLFRTGINYILCDEKKKGLSFLREALKYNTCIRNRVIYVLSHIHKDIITFLYRLYV